MIMVGSASAALKNWATAFGRSETGNSHQPSHFGVKGSALNVGTCKNRPSLSHAHESMMHHDGAHACSKLGQSLAELFTSFIRMSGCVRCRMRVKPTSFSPPGICCTNLYVPYLHTRQHFQGCCSRCCGDSPVSFSKPLCLLLPANTKVNSQHVAEVQSQSF